MNNITIYIKIAVKIYYIRDLPIKMWNRIMTDLNSDFKSYLGKADELTISNPAKAETYLLKLLKKGKFSLKEILQLKIKLAYALWSGSKTDDSYKIYLEVGKQARENSFEEETADSLEGKALFAGLKGNIKEGLEQVQEAIKIAKQRG